MILILFQKGLYNMKKVYWIIYVICFPLAMFQYALLALVEEYVIDIVTIGSFVDSKNFVTTMFFVTVGMLIIFISQWCVKISKISIIQSKIMNLKNIIFNNAFNKTIQEVKDNKNVVSSLLLNDIKTLENDYYPTMFSIIEQIAKLVIGIYMIVTRSAALGLFLVIGFLFPMLIPKLFNKAVKEKSLLYSEMNENYTNDLDESFRGVETIKHYNVEKLIKRDHNNNTNNLKKSYIRLNVLKETSSTLIWGMSVTVMIFGLFYGASLVLNHVLTIGAVMAVLQMSNSVSEPIVNISNNLNTLQSTKPIKDKICNYIKFDEYSICKEPIHNFEKEIELKAIFLKIGSKTILDNINFKISKGDKILVLGGNGAGKSSLLKVISGEITPTGGEILFDGKSSSMSGNNRNISFVSQNYFIFDDSLKNNITLNESFEKEEIDKTIIECELEEVLKEKGNSKLGKDGNTLSGGQKQRIEIARAIIRNREILIMDEAFSAIDNDSFIRLEKMLLKTDKTIFAISHKLNSETINDYTKILVLEDGHMKEYGDSNEVLKNKESYVFKMLV